MKYFKYILSILCLIVLSTLIHLSTSYSVTNTSKLTSVYKPNQSVKAVASWYGTYFHGRLTANGERYNMYAPTAAHKELPFGTWVRVTNLKNSKKTFARINDRGPYIKGRNIDLSYGVAKEIDMVGTGVSNVKLDIYKPNSIVANELNALYRIPSKSKKKTKLPHVTVATNPSPSL